MFTYTGGLIAMLAGAGIAVIAIILEAIIKKVKK